MMRNVFRHWIEGSIAEWLEYLRERLGDRTLA
jgi:hypothetical protein